VRYSGIPRQELRKPGEISVNTMGVRVEFRASIEVRSGTAWSNLLGCVRHMFLLCRPILVLEYRFRLVVWIYSIRVLVCISAILRFLVVFVPFLLVTGKRVCRYLKMQIPDCLTARPSLLGTEKRVCRYLNLCILDLLTRRPSFLGTEKQVSFSRGFVSASRPLSDSEALETSGN
jgi:hypothetical protein